MKVSWSSSILWSDSEFRFLPHSSSAASQSTNGSVQDVRELPTTPLSPNDGAPPPPPVSSLRTAITTGYVEIVPSGTKDGQETKRVERSGEDRVRSGDGHMTPGPVPSQKHRRHTLPPGDDDLESDLACDLSCPQGKRAASSLISMSDLAQLEPGVGPCLHPGYDRLAAAGTVGSRASGTEDESKHLSNMTDLELPVIIVTESDASLNAE